MQQPLLKRRLRSRLLVERQKRGSAPRGPGLQGRILIRGGRECRERPQVQRVRGNCRSKGERRPGGCGGSRKTTGLALMGAGTALKGTGKGSLRGRAGTGAALPPSAPPGGLATCWEPDVGGAGRGWRSGEKVGSSRCGEWESTDKLQTCACGPQAALHTREPCARGLKVSPGSVRWGSGGERGVSLGMHSRASCA